MSNLLQHWNLVTRPFEASWDARFFFRSAGHLEALDRLTYVAQEGGMNFALLTGEIGCGKTITRAMLQHELPASDFRLVTLENSGSSMDDLLGSLLRRLSPLDTVLPAERLARLDLLKELLELEGDSGRQVVVLLDEAQDLSLTTLNELRWLTNLNGGGRNLITLILIGQPNLRTMIQATPGVDQRISLRYHLQPLGLQELSDYLAHRLHVAGHPNGQLFEAEAVALLHELTRGVPRTVNRLAKLSLEFGWSCEALQISAAHVKAVAQDMAMHQTAIALAA
jgi:general secretion pathway protein A